MGYFSGKKIFVGMLLFLFLFSMQSINSSAAPLFLPSPSVTIDAPSNPFIGEDFTIEIRFKNTGETGYGPYIDLFLPLSGADGLSEISENNPGPNDGISFNNATFLGQTVTYDIISCPVGQTIIHPLTNLSVSCPAQPVGLFDPFEWQMIVITLPFGSYVSDQPDAIIEVSVDLSNYADLGVGLPIYAQSGFMFGADPLNNPSTDPVILGTIVSTTPIPTPKLVTLQKTYNGPENETATGPNYPRRYTITATIADGQTVQNLVVSDLLPDNMQFTSLVSSSPTASSCSLPSTTTPGGSLSCTFSSVTGSAIIVFEYYIPLRDAGGDSVINPVSGDDVNSCNNVTAVGDWDPLDPRDEGSTGNVNENPSGCEHNLQDKSIAIQKGVRVVEGGISAPGKTLEYTLNFQISDYFAFEDVVITDLISDGQHFVPSFVPTLSVNGNGFTSSPVVIDAANFDVICNYSGATNDGSNCTELDLAEDNGKTTFRFDISSELQTRSFDGKLIGGCVPPNGTGGTISEPIDPNCNTTNGGYNDGPTTGTIVFRTTILENFVDDFPSGDSSVDQGDVLGNTVTISGNLLSVSDADTPTGQSESDGSSASVSIPYGNITKSIYALNGSTSFSSPVRIAPGDTVTYRVRYTLPTSDFEDLVVTDYLPLPIFSSSEVIPPFIDSVCGIPTAGASCYGPSDNYHLISGAVTPVLTTNATANSIIWTYDDNDGDGRTSSEIDLLFTVTVNNDPFADGLFLTNQAQVVEGSTNASGNNANNIIQIQLTQPVVGITKGAVWTNRTNDPMPVFSTTPVGPVPFDGGAATCSTRFVGTVTTDGLIANPINSNVSNLDAGDSVMMAVVLENTGRYDAFDVQVKDSLPAGMTFVPGSLCVTNGAGTNLPFTDLGTGFFDQGIELTDTSSSDAALKRGKDSNDINNSTGTNIAVITYLATMDAIVEPGETYTNTSTLFNFAGTNDGPDHTTSDLDDNAQVTIFEPSVTKALTNTDRDFTTGNSVTIGEIIEYTVTVKLPEGTTNNVSITDTLDAGLAFVDCVSITPSSGISTDLTGGFESACNAPANPTVTFAGSDTTANQGRAITYTLGNITNANSDNSIEDTITIVYRAIVINSPGNNPAMNLNNDVTLTWDGGSASDSAENVIVVEPFLQVNKTASPATGVDAGDSITFSVAVSHSGQSGSNAFEAHIKDDLSTLPFTITALNMPVNFSGATCGTPNITDNSSGNIIDLVINQLPLGCSATLTYTATLNVTVTPGQVITNTANIDWTNLPDTLTNPSDYTDLDCERSGDAEACGAAANDYRASDPATVTIRPATFAKSIIATGIDNSLTTNTNNNLQAVIGETIDYRLVLTVPEGTVPDLTIVDLLDPGLAFVQCVNISTSTGLSTDLSGGFDSICPTTPQNPAVNPTITNIARTITFDLGTINNSNTDNNTPETITIDYRVVVLNVIGNQQGVRRNNSATPYTNNVGLTGSIQSPNITIIEPSPTVSKGATIGGDSIGLPGEPVIYTITIRNTSSPTTDAYDVLITDPLPKVSTTDNRSLITSPTITSVSGGDPSNFQLVGSDAGGWILNNVSSFDLLVGQTITITIQGNLLQVDPPAVSADQLIKNIVDMTWTSLDGNPGQISIYSGSSTERDGTGGVNDYATNDDADIRIENIVFSKELIDRVTYQPLTGQDVRIGETIRYRVSFIIPRDVYLDNLTFTDTLDDGLAYVACSGINAEADLTSSLENAFSCSNGTIAITNNGKNLAIGFENVQNRNLSESQKIVVEYDVNVLNTTFNDRGDQLNNAVTANFSVNNTTTSLNSQAPNVTINEPTLTITKQATPNAADAGDTITFTLTVNSQSGTNFNDAYDVVLEDVLPSGLTYVTDSFINTSGVAPTSGPAFDTGTSTFTAGWDVFPPGQTSVFTFQAVLDASVAPNQVITNSVSLNWTSMAGTVSDPSPYNESDCERTGNSADCGDSANDYSDDDSVSVTVNDVSFTKTLTATSATHTTGNNLTIGEVASFALTITLPEGTIPSLTVIDQIPSGMAYVADTFSIDDSNFEGSYGTPVVTPAANTNGANGQYLVIEFGEVVTTGGIGTTDNVLVINFETVVLNVISNQSEIDLVNTSSYQIGDNDPVSSNNITMPVVEPELSITKSFDGTNAPFEAGETVSYELVITNNSGFTAFDVVISDYAYATVSNVDAVPSPATLVGLQDLTSGNHVSFSVDEFPSGTSLTISYDVVLPNTLQVGETVANSASVTWTSLDGADDNERTGVEEDLLDNYYDEDTADFTTDQPTVEKSVNKTGATIGEVVRYTLIITSPKGTIEDWVIVDTLPAGLIYAGDISETGFDFPDPVVSTPNDGSAAVTVTWTMADPAVITENIMSISFDAIVADVSGNQNGDTPQNSVQMNYTDGYDQPQSDSDTSSFEIIEPDLEISKSFLPNPAGLGQTVTFTIALSHTTNSSATAYDVFLDDIIPTGLTYVADSIGGTCTSGNLLSVDTNSPTLSWTVDQLIQGASCSLTYQVTVTGTQLNQTLTNAVSGGYSSIPGTPDPDEERDYDLETEVSLVTTGSDLRIDKSDGGISAVPGGMIIYTLNYWNDGNGQATGVEITETVPANTTFTTTGSSAGWSCSDGAAAGSTCTLNLTSLTAGANGNVTFAVTVNNPLPTGITQTSNTAVIADDGTNGIDPTPGNNTSTDPTPLTAAPDMTITKVDDVVDSTTPGATIVYTLTYDNIGNQDATGVVVTETVPDNTTFTTTGSTSGWSCAPDNNAGSTCTLTLGTVTAADAAGTLTFAVVVDDPLAADVTEIDNTVSIADDGTNGVDPTPDNNSDNEVTPVDAQPDLTITKTDNDFTAEPGDTIVYDITYDNTGNQTATGVVITETVPDNTTFNAAESETGWSCADGVAAGTSCTFSVGTLPVDGGDTILFAVDVINPVPSGIIQIDNLVSISDDGNNSEDPITDSDDEVTPLTAAPDMTITKVDDVVDSTTPGATIVYTLTYDNIGNQDATGVVVTETVPANTTFTTTGSTSGWSCTPDNNAGSTCTLTLGTVTAADAAGTLTFAVVVDNPLAAEVTQINNAVSIADDGANGVDPTPDNNSDNEVTPVDAQPALTITKTDKDYTAEPGNTIVYEITYGNTGNQTATGVVITETVPDNTTFNAAESETGWSCADGAAAGTTCTFSVGTLPVDGGDTILFAVDVINLVPSGIIQIDNLVSISDDGNNSEDPITDSDDEVTPLTAAPDIAVEKTNGINQTAPGATLTYTITVRNLGEQDATGVLLEDTIPTGTSFVEANRAGEFDEDTGVISWPTFDLAAGDSETFTITLLVDDPLDMSIVSIVNSVVAQDDGSNGEDPDDENNTYVDEDMIGLGYKQVEVGDMYGDDNPEPPPGSEITVRIGDVVTYEVGLLVGVETTLEDLLLTDILDRGLVFIDCEINADGLVEDPNHPFEQICNPDLLDPSMIVETEPGDSPNPADAGRKLTLTFGTVSNETQEDQYVIVRYRVKVLNSAENMRGLLLANTAEWDWIGGNVPLQAEDLKIVEPELFIEKSVEPETAMIGQEVTFTLKIAHSEESDVNAYDVVFEDVIPTGLTYVVDSLVFVEGQEPTSLNDSSAPQLTISWDVFELTEQITEITFRAKVDRLNPGQSATNLATIQWSSLPDYLEVPQSPYNPELSTERTYIPDSQINVYGASSSATINVPELPQTGFAPGVITQLPQMPSTYQYNPTGGMVLSIPKLGVNSEIIGIPLQNGEWNLTWLGKQAGYLEGTAFPTWNGNSAITAHVSNADGTPGPFAALGSLKWGDTITIFAFGQTYTYSVRETMQVYPSDTRIFKSETNPWLTLITCRGYDPNSNTYDYRVVVRAVLIDVSE